MRIYREGVVIILITGHLRAEGRSGSDKAAGIFGSDEREINRTDDFIYRNNLAGSWILYLDFVRLF